MSEALRLAEDLRRQFMNDDHNFDTMIEASIELRRLADVEQELEALKRAISEAEPVAWANPSDMIDASTSFRWIQISDFSEPLYTLKGIK